VSSRTIASDPPIHSMLPVPRSRARTLASARASLVSGVSERNFTTTSPGTYRSRRVATSTYACALAADMTPACRPTGVGTSVCALSVAATKEERNTAVRM
jgi:hypothetical protein